MALIARLPLRARLGLYRLGYLAACALVPALVAFAGLARGPGRNPLMTAHGAHPLPFVETMRLLIGLSPVFWGAAGLALALAVVFDVRLTAGALAVLDETDKGRPVPASLREVLRAGMPHRPAFFRVLAIVASLIAGGSIGLGLVFHQVDLAATRAHETALHRVVLGAGGRTLATLLLAALAGGFGLACRALIVEGDRRFVLRAAWIALRACARRPLAGPLLFVAVSLPVEIACAAALALPHLARPPAGAAALRAALVLGVLAIQAATWLFLVGRMRALWSHPRLAPLRAEPDAPLNLWSRLRARLRFRRPAAAPPPVAAPPSDGSIDG